MNKLKVQIHYTSGYTLAGSLIIVLVNYLARKEIPDLAMLLLVVSIVVYVFTEKGGGEWMM